MYKVQVLMSTYNGEKYIKEQIESILKQQDVEISLLIRDDGSTDKTIEIINKMSNIDKRVEIYEGKNIGPAKSFMDLICKSEDYDYYAFSDQDDVWQEKKLISAIKMFKNKENEPSLYISALEVVDENLKFIKNKKVVGNFSFEGELIKNFATGCTQVFNKKLRDIIKKHKPNYIIMHDSWITRVCYGIGGNVLIDENSYIKYRQHNNNVLGYKENALKKIIKQYKIGFKNKEKMRVNIAKELKNGYYEVLTKEVKEVVDNLILYEHDQKAKKWLLHNKNFRTNNIKTNIKLLLAISLRKF